MIVCIMACCTFACTGVFMSCLRLIVYTASCVATGYRITFAKSRASKMVVAELLEWGSPLPLVLLTVLLQFHPRLHHKQDLNFTAW